MTFDEKVVGSASPKAHQNRATLYHLVIIIELGQKIQNPKCSLIWHVPQHLHFNVNWIILWPGSWL